jgi:alkyl sulfatase BDS1-like metallo-beta-lactamase superfamily hydrolase
MLTVPMVAAGVKAKHVIRRREDYSHGDILARDSDGRVVMSVQTVRDDGEDCTVFAPTAVQSMEGR